MRCPSRSRIVAGLTLASIVSIQACDPGASYRPIGWERASNSSWTTRRGPLEIETRGFGGLSLSKAVTPEFTVQNRADSAAIFGRAVLQTKVGQFTSRGPRAGEERWYTVEPGARQRITFTFDLRGHLEEVLAGPLTLTLMANVGPETIEIPIQVAKE
jgi:hypothetical protein